MNRRLLLGIGIVFILQFSGCNPAKEISPTSSPTKVGAYLGKISKLTEIKLTENPENGEFTGTCLMGETPMALKVTVTKTKITWDAASEEKRVEGSDGSVSVTGSAKSTGSHTF